MFNWLIEVWDGSSKPYVVLGVLPMASLVEMTCPRECERIATMFPWLGLEGVAAKIDVFHILSGMWKTPAESCIMWIGGFCPSELLKLGPLKGVFGWKEMKAKLLVNQLEPLTEQQLMGICNLQQAEYAVNGGTPTVSI